MKWLIIFALTLKKSKTCLHQLDLGAEVKKKEYSKKQIIKTQGNCYGVYKKLAR